MLQTSDNSNGREPNGRASYHIPRCRTLRESAGMSINTLAKNADVDRGTISRIERSHPVTAVIAGRVFNVLNEVHKNQLSREAEVTTSPGRKSTNQKR